MHQLITAWQQCELNKPPFVLPFDSAPGITFQSYAEFVQSSDFGVISKQFHLGLIPQPYIGNLAKAKVFLLLLNPGFSAGDYYAQEEPAFREARVTNLRQENGEEAYPFFYLNPEFAWTAGGQWWQSKLDKIARKLAKHEGLRQTQNSAYKSALQFISKSLACIELCPYFSKEYQQGKSDMRSLTLARSYVQSELLQKCVKCEAVAVITRQVKAWGLENSEAIFCLQGGQTRGAHLTIDVEAEVGAGTGAGDFIYDQLVKVLQSPR